MTTNTVTTDVIDSIIDDLETKLFDEVMDDNDIVDYPICPDREALDLIARVLQKNPGRILPLVVIDVIRDIVNSTGRDATLQ